jgi:hypothetical protein
MHQVKLVCRKRALKNGLHLIWVQYCQKSNKRVQLSSKISIPVDHWSVQKEKILSDLPYVLPFLNAQSSMPIIPEVIVGTTRSCF